MPLQPKLLDNHLIQKDEKEIHPYSAERRLIVSSLILFLIYRYFNPLWINNDAFAISIYYNGCIVAIFITLVINGYHFTKHKTLSLLIKSILGEIGYMLLVFIIYRTGLVLAFFILSLAATALNLDFSFDTAPLWLLILITCSDIGFLNLAYAKNI